MVAGTIGRPETFDLQGDPGRNRAFRNRRRFPRFRRHDDPSE